MKKILLCLVVLLSAGCSSPEAAPTDAVFQKGELLFKSPTPQNTLPPTQTLTPAAPFPTKQPPTQIVWPEPYGGKSGPTPVTPVPTPFETASETDKITFLLIGADRITSGYFRTDTIMLAIYFPEQQAVNLISIPRDLYVYIPGWTMNRINAAFAHGISSQYPGGGAQLLADTIHYNLGIVVDHFGLVDFSGFQAAVDVFDGIEVNVLCPYTDWRLIEPDLDPDIEENWELFTLPSGPTTMDGYESLWYARSRMKSDDFDRGRRQQEIIRALFNRMLQLDLLIKLPELFAELNSKIETDLGLTDMIQLAPFLLQVKPERIHHYYIDRDQVNGWTTPGGGSVQLPDAEPFAALLQEAAQPLKWDFSDDISPEVEIWNSSGNPGYDQLAVERLNYLGIPARAEVSGSGILPTSVFKVFAVEPSQDLISKIKTNFELNFDQIEYVPDPSALQEYILVLGTDYNPCFYPNAGP